MREKLWRTTRSLFAATTFRLFHLLRNRAAIWFFLSIAMFVAGGVLTRIITHIDGHAPFLSGKFPAERQWIAVYSEDPTMRIYYDIYDSHPYFEVFAFRRPVTLVLDHLSYCAAAASRTDFDSRKDVIAIESPNIWSVPNATPLNVAYFNPRREWRDGGIMRCYLQPIALNHTFTEKEMFFEIFDLDRYPVPKGPLVDGLRTLTQVKKLELRFSILGAEQFKFSDGSRSPDKYEPDSVYVAPGTFLSISWRDTRREQIRDLLLIVIGTLLGLAVTTLIEALRVLVDRAEKQARN